MKNLKRLLSASLILSLTGLPAPALSNELVATGLPLIYIWTNKSGFKTMEGCQNNTRPDQRFRIVNNNQSLLDSELKPTDKKVPRHSLVKIIGDEPIGNTELVEVTGVQSGTKDSAHVERGDSGHLPELSLESILPYMIELGDVGIIPKMPGLQVRGSMLESVQAEGGGFVVYTCDKKDYTAFKLVTGKAGDPKVSIGVHWDETKVLRDIHVHTKDSGLRQLAAREQARVQAELKRMAEEAAAAALRKAEEDRVAAELRAAAEAKQAEGNAIAAIISANAGAGDRARAAAKAKADALALREMEQVMDQVDPTVYQEETYTDEEDDVGDTEDPNSTIVSGEEVEGDLAFVICLPKRNELINVKDEAQKTKLFSLINGTEIKLFQDDEGTAPKSIVKIQDSKTARIGWIPQEVIQHASTCPSLESDAPAAGNSGSLDPAAPLALGQYAVCTKEGDPLSVYDMDFNLLRRRFYLESGEKVTVIDGTPRDRPTPNGFKYVKVTTQSNYTRFVAKDYLTQDKCETAALSADYDASSAQNIDGYVFPVTKPTGFSYIAKSKRDIQDPYFSKFDGYNGNWGLYGASRGGGSRGHAATDLYQPRGMPRPSKDFTEKLYGGPVIAMKDGKVIRGATKFYSETFYIVVHNDDGTVSRYGEIYEATAYPSKRVKAGDLLGWVKWVKVNSVPPMLHFENYYPNDADVRKGFLKGNKRVNRRNTQRSKYLFDRTKFMLELEKKTFYPDGVK